MATYNSYYSTTDTTWANWCGDSGTTTATDTTWNHWCDGTADTTNSYIWINWCTEGPVVQSSGSGNTITLTASSPRIPTEEERRQTRMRERAERRLRMNRSRMLTRQRIVAENKALQLLEDLIGPEQRKVYEETGRLFVKGQKYDWLLRAGGIPMRIERDRVMDLCIHLPNRHSLPETDNIIALKCLVEADEELFRRTGNARSFRNRNEKIDLQINRAAKAA